jgi:hypothetical protein
VTSGELVRVLAEWRLPAVDAWAVFPGRRLMPAKTRVFLDMLAEWFDPQGTQPVAAAPGRARTAPPGNDTNFVLRSSGTSRE